jgi:hypothetical protein
MTVQAKDLPLHAVFFEGTAAFADFVDGLIKMSHEADVAEFNGHLVAWVIKASTNGEERKEQYKFMSQALRRMLGPQEQDLGVHKRTNDTGTLQ